MIKKLKAAKYANRTEKPNLNLKPNHYQYYSEAGRIWNSKMRGTAISDGNGWYKEANDDLN